MTERQKRLERAKAKLIQNANYDVAEHRQKLKEKPKRLTLTRIFALYENSFLDQGKKPLSVNRNKVNYYCKHIKDRFKTSEAIKEYFDYCVIQWDELVKIFSTVSNYGPPLAFIATSSVIDKVLEFQQGLIKAPKKRKVKIKKLSNRGKYDDQEEGHWIDTPEELHTFQKAKAEGILLKNRDELLDYLGRG